MANYANLRHRNSEKARHLLRRSGYKAGGAVSDDAQDKKLVKKGVRQHENHEHGGKHTALKLKDGGSTDGSASHQRPDRKPRASGGRTKKGHPTVNVIIAGQGAAEPRPVPVPMPMGGPPGGGAPPPMAPRPPMPMPPPGAAGPGAGMPPPGMPPRPMAATGGRIGKADGGSMAAPFRSNPNAPDEAPKERIKRGLGKAWDMVKDAVTPTPPTEATPTKSTDGGSEGQTSATAIPEKRGGRAKRQEGGANPGADRGSNRRSGKWLLDKITTSPSGPATASPTRGESGSGAKGMTPPVDPPATPPAGPDTGEKRGGRQRRAEGGRLSPTKLDTARPLDYEGSNKNANSIRSSKKNNGSSNEGDRAPRMLGGRTIKQTTLGGGLGRIEKARLYGAKPRD